MFTHRAKIQLKPDSLIELSQKIHNQIMPALRRQAEVYQRAGYPETLKLLSGLTDPEAAKSIFEVSDSAIKESGKPVFVY